MNNFQVYDKQEKCFLEPIYEAYKGKLFDFYLGSSGTLTFRCEGMQDKGFPNGYTHESIITKGKDRFLVIINAKSDDEIIQEQEWDKLTESEHLYNAIKLLNEDENIPNDYMIFLLRKFEYMVIDTYDELKDKYKNLLEINKSQILKQYEEIESYKIKQQLLRIKALEQSKELVNEIKKSNRIMNSKEYKNNV